MENNFTSEIKSFLIDELNEVRGEERTVYPEDLYMLFTEYINIFGSVHCSIYSALDFIANNIVKFSDLCYYLRNGIDMDLNPILEPEKAEVIACIEGVRYLLGQLESLEKAVNESEFDTIILTDSLISQMVEELENNEYDITF